MARTLPDSGSQRGLVVMLAVALATWVGSQRRAEAYYSGAAQTFNYEYAPTYDSYFKCDDCIKTVTLPFSFPYYGKTFSSITISSNGFVVMGNSTFNSFSNRQLSWDGTTLVPAGFIAPFWDDWNLSTQGAVYYGQVGDHFVIEWYRVWHLGDTSGNYYTFELKLFPNGAIEVHWGTVVVGKAWDGGASATIGYQEGTNTVGDAGWYNTNVIPNNFAWRWNHPGKVAVYVEARDGFTGAPRPNAGYAAAIQCKNSSGNAVTGTISIISQNDYNQALGKLGTSASPLGNCSYNYPLTNSYVQLTGASPYPESGPIYRVDESGMAMAADASGRPVVQMAPYGGTTVRSGLYTFHRDSSLTPAPVRTVTWNVTYPQTPTMCGAFSWESWAFPPDMDGSFWWEPCDTPLPQTTRTGRLHYWGDGAINKPIVIIPGFDPLNQTSTAFYLAAMSSLAAPLMASGYDIAIGEFAWKWEPMQNFDAEVRAWIEDAYNRNTSSDKRVDAVGVSMGGVLIRQALTNPFGNAAEPDSQLKRWFSIDSPHKGAHLTSDRGIQQGILWSVVYADYDGASDPWDNEDYQKLFAPGAWQMKRTTPWTCSLDDEPENGSCAATQTYWTSYYSTLPWPSQPATRYAVAFGDADGTWSNMRSSAGKLYDFVYGGTCSDDGDWNGAQRDYLAGSRYLDTSMVNETSYLGWYGFIGCVFGAVHLQWEPAFINVDSALGFTLSTGAFEDAKSYPGAYSFTPAYWTGWKGNSSPYKHTQLTCTLRDQLCTWINGSNVCSGRGGCYL